MDPILSFFLLLGEKEGKSFNSSASRQGGEILWNPGRWDAGKGASSPDERLGHGLAENSSLNTRS